MGLEEALNQLKNLGSKPKLMPALVNAGITFAQYQRDPINVLKELDKQGHLLFPSFPTYDTNVPFENVREINSTIIMDRLMQIRPGQSLVIPPDAHVFPEDEPDARGNFFKKGGVLLTKPLSEIDPDGSRKPEENLPHAQLSKYRGHLNVGDTIVGYRVTGNREGNHIVPITSIIRAQIMHQNLEKKLIVVDYSGSSRKEGKVSLANVPSFSSSRTYDFVMFEVPAYRGRSAGRETQHAAYNVCAPKHDCGVTKWYPVKDGRIGYSIDQKTGRLARSVYYSREELVCTHRALGTMEFNGFLKEEGKGWKMLFPYLQFNDNWTKFLMVLHKDVSKLVATTDDKGKTHFKNKPLNFLDMEILCWKRIAYLDSGLHKRLLEEPVPEEPEWLGRYYPPWPKSYKSTPPKR